MESPAKMRQSYQRFFAWSFVLAPVAAAAAAGTVNPGDFASPLGGASGSVSL
jgi:hypothetical protein